jgi:hypothetical protein
MPSSAPRQAWSPKSILKVCAHPALCGGIVIDQELGEAKVAQLEEALPADKNCDMVRAQVNSLGNDEPFPGFTSRCNTTGRGSPFLSMGE